MRPFWVREDKNFLFLCSSLVRVNSFSKVCEFKLSPFILLFLISLYFFQCVHKITYILVCHVHIFTHIESSILNGLFIAHFLLLRMKEFVLLNLIKNKQLGKQFKGTQLQAYFEFEILDWSKISNKKNAYIHNNRN